MPEQIRALASLVLDHERVVLAALTASRVVFYDTNGHALSDPAPLSVGPVNAMTVVSHEGRDALATGGGGTGIRLWTGHASTEHVRLDDTVGDVTAMRQLTLATGRRVLAVGTADGSVLGLDLTSLAWMDLPVDAGLQAIFALSAVSLPQRDGLVSPPQRDGLLAVAGEDRAIRVCDLASGHILSVYSSAHDHAIRALAFIPDGADPASSGPNGGADGRLVSADDDGCIKLWRLGDHLELIREFEHRHHQSVSSLAIMPGIGGEEATLFSAGRDEVILPWKLDGSPVDPPLIGHIGSVTAVVAVVTPHGDRVLASAGLEGKVRRWNADSDRSQFPTESIGRIHSLTTVLDGDELLLAASGDDGRIRVRDRAATPERSVPLPGKHDGSAFRVACLPDRLPGAGLVSVGEDGTMLCWADLAAEPRVLAAGLGKLFSVCDVELPSGAPGIACAGERGVFVLDPADPEATAELIFAGHSYALVSGELTDRSQGVAAAGRDGVVRLLNPAKEEPVETWIGHDGPVRCLAKVSRPGERNSLLSAGTDGTVRIWDTRTGSRILAQHDGTVLDMTVVSLPDGRQMLLSSGEGGKVMCLDLNAIKDAEPVRTELSVVSALCPVPDGGAMRAALGSVDGKIRLATFSATYGDMRFRGASDRAVQHDRFYRKNLIAEMMSILLHTSEESHEAGPTVLAAEGAWGSGKSSMLAVLRRELDELDREKSAREGAPAGRPRLPRLTAARADVLLGRPSPGSRRVNSRVDSLTKPQRRRLVTAWFNPWAHQTSEQIWAGLAQSILEAAGAALHPARGDRDWYWLSRNRRHSQTRHLRWALRRRTLSPLLAVVVAALLVPVLAKLIDPDLEWNLLGHDVLGAQVAMVAAAAALAVGLLHSLLRYYTGHASRWLPSELFAGPLPSGGQSVTGAGLADPIRDPLYRARAGYLYLAQHDVANVLQDLGTAGVELVVFVDDLDRCNPTTTAEVLEAINLFLSGQLPSTRFVLGLDPNVVAAQLDSTYAGLAARHAISSEDPSPGWTFLRKLVQLPVVLPRLSDATLDRLMSDLLQPAITDGPAPPGAPGQAVAGSGSDGALPPDGAGEPDGDPGDAPAASDAPAPAGSDGEPATGSPAEYGSGEPLPVCSQVARDRHPLVRTLLDERIRQQPERSPRDIKRLLTVWQFYVRVLDRLADASQATGDNVVVRARNLVVFAEIITRWPALCSRLQAAAPAPAAAVADAAAAGPAAPDWRALDELARVARDHFAWDDALVRLGLDGETDREATRHLRQILRDYEGAAVAELARRVW
ncbi:P-loop NTPase fold protein [Mangrovihabitans endophyticus]|nr:P-loop NTPase fold protein [Mangrovihabitans endophyticus]